MQTSQILIPTERIANSIYNIRSMKVMLDSDLAALYGVSTGRLNEQVKRNIERFPEDFAFQLTMEEYNSLISQNAISKTGRGGRRKLPRVFTEHGILMLSSVLRSDQAVQVNIAIMRTFTQLRKLLATNEALAKKIEEHDHHIGRLYDLIQKMFEPTHSPKRNLIGYVKPKK